MVCVCECVCVCVCVYACVSIIYAWQCGFVLSAVGGRHRVWPPRFDPCCSRGSSSRVGWVGQARRFGTGCYQHPDSSRPGAMAQRVECVSRVARHTLQVVWLTLCDCVCVPQAILASLPIDVKLCDFNLAREHDWDDSYMQKEHEAAQQAAAAAAVAAGGEAEDDADLPPPPPSGLPSLAIAPTYLVVTSWYRPPELMMNDNHCTLHGYMHIPDYGACCLAAHCHASLQLCACVFCCGTQGTGLRCVVIAFVWIWCAFIRRRTYRLVEHGLHHD